ncbi:MAG: signal peptide peptidase SppA [Nitrospinae bacterium CG11_big_fil_rev_8_21_14_0_20_56_8]|nr:MAG: signal peptide peptidase SppA [Nitrospinae bacterium CG11_big_fil_rev_8_21_14_0_20_56_8]
MIFLGAAAGIALLSVAATSILPKSIIGSGKIAVVEVAGIITDSRDVVRQLARYRKDRSVLGIVLRVDSPGGAVGPSQEIYDEVVRVRDSHKTIYASLGSIAASGGYYIASPTHRVIANPGTLTGSIGVIMAFSNVEELIGKIGVKPEVIKSGQFKDAGSPVRPMTQQEREYLQTVVDDVHGQFIQAVAEGRDLPVENVRKIADGRIFTGKQAFELKLVDELGGLESAIARLAREVGIEGEPRVVQEEKHEGLLDLLLQSITPNYFTNRVTHPVIPSLQLIWTVP